MLPDSLPAELAILTRAIYCGLQSLRVIYCGLLLRGESYQAAKQLRKSVASSPHLPKVPTVLCSSGVTFCSSEMTPLKRIKGTGDQANGFAVGLSIHWDLTLILHGV